MRHLSRRASLANVTVRRVYSAGLSCGGCFAAYDAAAGAEDELYTLFCKFCGAGLEVPRNVTRGPSVQNEKAPQTRGFSESG